jgi:hypothetical protein
MRLAVDRQLPTENWRSDCIGLLGTRRQCITSLRNGRLPQKLNASIRTTNTSRISPVIQGSLHLAAVYGVAWLQVGMALPRGSRSSEIILKLSAQELLAYLPTRTSRQRHHTGAVGQGVLVPVLLIFEFLQAVRSTSFKQSRLFKPRS